MERQTMQSFVANDGVELKYLDTGAGGGEEAGKPWLVMIHGFTGTSAVWQRNIPGLKKSYRVVAPDLRGHGQSGKPKHGFHVSRLAMDLRELLEVLAGGAGKLDGFRCRAIGGSLGCSILWSYAELFTTAPFTHVIFIDQSPLQNSTLDGWDSRFCNRGMNSSTAVASLQTTLALSPATAHKDTIAACLSYRSHPLPTDTQTAAEHAADEAFFLEEALKGDGEWYGKLMANHTALDWRESVRANWGTAAGSRTKVLVIASERSGCFPSEGVMKIVEFVNAGAGEGNAKGVVVRWGGHWCYWENAPKFESLIVPFLTE